MWNNLLLVTTLIFIVSLKYTLSKPNVEDYWTKLVKCPKCGVMKYSTNPGAAEEIPIGITVLNGTGSYVSFSVTLTAKSNCKLKKCYPIISNITCHNLGKEHVEVLHRNQIILIDCSCKSDNVPEIYKEKQFNRKFIGAVFSPYTKNWFKSKDSEPELSKWDNYTISEIEIMLKVLATRFSLISTYGIGGYIDWTQGESAGFVPIAAAKVNTELYKSKSPTIQIFQGIDPYDSVERAFNKIKEANELFAGTVQAIIFISDLDDERTAENVIQRIGKAKNRAKEFNLKIGIRLRICHDIIPKMLPETNIPENSTHTKFSKPKLERLFRQLLLPHVDIIICASNLESNVFHKDLQNLVQEHGSNFLRIKDILQWFNPKVRIICQTGWPSSGISDFNDENTTKNMIEYWNTMSDWAENNSIELEFFEAFDEPWRIDLTHQNGSNPYGSAGDYGWWRRYDDKAYGSPVKAYSYIPKVAEVLDEIEQDQLQTSTSTENLEGVAVGDGSLIIIAFAVIILVIVVSIIGTLFWRLRKAKNNIVARSTQEIAKEFRYGVQVLNKNEEIKPSLMDKEVKDKKNNDKSFVVLKFPYDRRHELCSKKFQIDNSWIIGRGNFGTVYRGKIDGVQSHVAFKTLNSNGSLIELKNLLSEIKIMSYVGNHPNIVNLLGAYTAKIEKGEVYVASEYCDLGNLEKYLKAQKPIPGFPNQPMLNYVVAHFESGETPNFIQPKTISQKDLLKWAYQIACGMEYIAGKKVIHSDLACRNVLLTKDENAKIADFGLSKQLYYNTQYLKANTKEELPWRWMSLESLKTLTFSIESDVWSYGICIWEMFSYGDTPYPGVIGWNQGFLYELDVNNYKMAPPTNCPAQISDLMLNCWDNIPTNRPTFTQLKDEINELYQQES